MKALLLLSGGIDSPVAGYLIQKEGNEVIALHFYNQHLSDINTVEKCQKICSLLGIKKLFLIPFDEEQTEIANKCRHRLYFVLQRRLMLRIAERIAEKENCDFLVTGENLGQVASQTLSNMINITKAVKIPVLRPILCHDKNETIKIAKAIGTYQISKGPEICCLLGPKHPVTRSKVEIIEEEEKKLDINFLIKESLSKLKTKTNFYPKI